MNNIKYIFLKVIKFKFILFCILFCFYIQSSKAQFIAKITNLNNLKEFYLREGDKYYFQLKKNNEVFYLDFISAEKDNLVFEGKKVNPDDLSWVSKTYYKNSKLSELRRSSALNLGVMTKPTYDLEEKYFLEIVPDTATFVFPKK